MIAHISSSVSNLARVDISLFASRRLFLVHMQDLVLGAMRYFLFMLYFESANLAASEWLWSCFLIAQKK